MNKTQLDAFVRQETPTEGAALRGEFFPYELLPIAGRYHGQPYLNFTPQPEGSANWAKEHKVSLEHYQNLAVARQDRYQAVPLHIHPWIELNYMYSGSCELTVNDTVLEMRQGQLCLINTDAPHACSACGEGDILVNFLITKDYLDSNFFSRLSRNNILTNFFIETMNSRTDQDNFIFFHAEKNENIGLYIRQFMCEYYEPSGNTQSILDSLMTLILCELINVFERDLRHSRTGSADRAVAPILRYIERNCTSCTLESTAERFHMHPNYLSVYLKQHTGYTFKGLVQTQRLQQAVHLLQTTSLSVNDISYQIGYSNTSFFFQKFKEAYGCTPKEYRAKLNQV